MKNFLAATALSASVVLTPLHSAHAGMAVDWNDDGEIHFCEMTPIFTAGCLSAAVGGILLLLSIASDAHDYSSSKPNRSAEPSLTIGGNASPEGPAADPTPDYSIHSPDEPQDIHEQGCLWGSRATDTC